MSENSIPSDHTHKQCTNCYGEGIVRVKPSTLPRSEWRKPIPKITCPVCAGSGKVKIVRIP